MRVVIVVFMALMRMLVVFIVPMFFMIRMIVVIVFVFMRMIFMFVVIVIVILCMVVMFIMIVMVVVIMRFEQCIFSEIQQNRTVGLQQRSYDSVRCKRFNSVIHPRRQIFANPKHNARVLQSFCVRGAKVVFMRRCASGNDQIRFSDALHHARYKGVDRRDIHGDARCISQNSR